MACIQEAQDPQHACKHCFFYAVPVSRSLVGEREDEEMVSDY